MTDRPPIRNRREFLAQNALGMGTVALATLLNDDKLLATPANIPRGQQVFELAPKQPHFEAKARSMISLFMHGAPALMDLTDPKPELQRLNGKTYQGDVQYSFIKRASKRLLGSRRKFQKHGQCGTEISELLPHIAGCVDDICVVRSMVADNINHGGAALQMHTGEQAFSRPAVGAWATYGLGTENENLPGFVVSSPQPTFQSGPLYGASFLSAAYQGTLVRDLANPIRDLRSTPKEQKRQLAQIAAIRRLHELRRDTSPNAAALDARISSFELAYRMQVRAPEAFEIERESEYTQTLYGIGNKETEPIGKQLLLARRLSERGVRFIQVFDSSGGNNVWDHHGGINNRLPKNCRQTDLPIAGFLKDLKERGLLDDTLVVWGGEFGRTPTSEGTDGREHHPFGFTMWLAGGGIKGGHVHGATDDFGWHAVKDKVHVHDLHATSLHTLGLDHEELTFRYGGRDFRLTDVHGRVVREILA